MKSKSPIVITISRQLGSGGGAYIGQQLAKKLDIIYMDREIISQAAKQLSVFEEDLESSDEKIPSFWQSFFKFGVFLHGNLDFRRERVQKLYNLSAEAARKTVAHSDSERARYHHSLTEKEWNDARQYNLCIDTSKIGVDNTVEFILKYLELY